MNTTARTVSLIPAAVAALALAACSVATGSGPASAQAAAPQTETIVQTEISVRGVAKAIDAGQRLLTLETATGLREFSVDGGVAGLDHVHAGDVVDVRYQRSILFDMQPAGSAEPGAYFADSGEAGGEQVTVLAEVFEVDGTAASFSVKGPSGDVRTFHAEEPVHVEAVRGIKIGDMLRVRFREGVVVSLEKVEQQ